MSKTKPAKKRIRKPETKKRSHHKKKPPVDAAPASETTAPEAMDLSKPERLAAPHPGTSLDYQTRNIQQTFRTTADEHAQLCDDAKAAGYGKLAKYYRSRLGLPA